MKKLFLNKKFFLVCVILAVVGQVYRAIQQMSIPEPNLSVTLCMLAFGICEIVLYSSFKNHEKNLMKGIMGALLMGHFVLGTTWLGAGSAVDVVFGLIYIVVVACILINHFMIAADRHSMIASIKLNQVLVIIGFVCVFAWDVVGCCAAFSAGAVVDYLLDIVALFGVFASIVCVETMLDSFKSDREAAGWTEEKGYPEGYVHQKDKK